MTSSTVLPRGSNTFCVLPLKSFPTYAKTIAHGIFFLGSSKTFSLSSSPPFSPALSVNLSRISSEIKCDGCTWSPEMPLIVCDQSFDGSSFSLLLSESRNRLSMDVRIVLFFLVKSSFRRRVVLVQLFSFLQNVETKLEDDRNVLESIIRRDDENIAVLVVIFFVIFAFVSRACFVRCAIARVMLSMCP